MSRRHDQKHAYGDESPEEGGGRGGPGDEVEDEGEQGAAAQLLAVAGGGVDQQEQAQQGRHQQAHIIGLETRYYSFCIDTGQETASTVESTPNKLKIIIGSNAKCVFLTIAFVGSIKTQF